MTDRERLFQLIGQVQDEGLDYSDVVVVYKTSNERLTDYLINNGVTFAKDINVPSWIPVTERLPVDWCPVLVMIRDVEKPLLGSYRGNVWFHEMWNTNFINGAVTHWMPLPEPPKEG